MPPAPPDILRDVNQTVDLPDTIRAIYSRELDYTSRAMLIYDQPQWIERKSEFAGEKGSTVVWTVYQNLPPSIRPLIEDQDVRGMSVADFQTSLTVEEYGTAIGTAAKLDLLSYHGTISSLVRTLLAPQLALSLDLLARNALWGPQATYRSYAGAATSRATLTQPQYKTDGSGEIDPANRGSAISPEIIKRAVYNLNTRRIPPVDGAYICIAHPAVVHDVRSDPFWIDMYKYTDPERMLQGEVGKLHGCRFIEGHNARIPNGAGSATAVQTTLAGDARAGRDFIVVADATGLNIGDEITLHRHATVPDGTDETAEEVVIKAISGTRLYLTNKLTIDHYAGDYVTEDIDVYPLVFLGATPPAGRGAVLEPEVRVALPTDKLQRMHHVGWYGLFGYGILRNWALEVVEVTAGVPSAPAFPW